MESVSSKVGKTKDILLLERKFLYRGGRLSKEENPVRFGFIESATLPWTLCYFLLSPQCFGPPEPIGASIEVFDIWR